ncbi:endopeptidase La [Leptotrichia sp. oral taxon 221]|jgi:endopeptidase La|uniref:endopeptidase La n=1 Tax=Leptotrichia sp. oral taxon 221 TaxID=712362 RepID=UPI001B8D009A|nr:endopeptidase La [Leptotrichia sp. oral taxon 221]QUB97847.1 endopeptidase La [Leptotrichia sp. oral taxon 221]
MQKKPFIATRELVVFPGVVTPIFIGRPSSLASIEESLAKFDNKLVLSSQKDGEIEEPKLPEDVYETGVLVHVLQSVRMPNGNVKVLVEAKHRVLITDVTNIDGINYADYTEVFSKPIDESKSEALKRKVIDEFANYAKITQKVLPDIIYNIKDIKNTDKAFDLICTNLMIPTVAKQELLEILDVEERAYKILSIIEREIEIFTLEKEIENRVKEQMAEVQKNYYLREKIKAIKEEIGEEADSDEEIAELEQKIEDSKIPEDLKGKLVKEIARLKRMPDFSSEASVIRSYVETVLELPWDKSTKDEIDIKKAQEILDEDHYGLEEVKERILEFLAVKKLNNTLKGSIICLVGPPGVGKTSLAHSIARSMNRKFTRISLGGVRDEAEIRGHRRTYVGAMPGRIVNSLKQVGVNNPVMLFDEIDKMASDFRGDPASAMLEVLDPAQNSTFEDHYIDHTFDLSKVFFVCTANDIGGIPGPLRDRMEIIFIESYTEFEKLNIAKKYLIPQTKEENGLNDYKIPFSDASILKVINEYTREAGVRSLRREISKIFRKMAKEILLEKTSKLSVTETKIKKYLGNAKYRADKIKKDEGKIGVVNGLAWTAVGGTTLEVQAVKMEGKGLLQLTGKLGDVMQESARVAYSYVRHIKNELGIEEKFNEKTDVHLHFPEGAVPKDGPSAGITITTAIISVLANKEVRQDVAMTGEITITGEVLAVGGIKEKVIGAHRVGIREVVLPFDNKVDTEELPKEIASEMKFHFAKTYEDVKKIVFVDTKAKPAKKAVAKKKTTSKKVTEEE